jgi:hypothetical protein
VQPIPWFQYHPDRWREPIEPDGVSAAPPDTGQLVIPLGGAAGPFSSGFSASLSSGFPSGIPGAAFGKPAHQPGQITRQNASATVT